MAEQWITAAQTLGLVGDAIALCTRLHAGMIRARARLLKIDTNGEVVDAVVPKNFWWGLGHAVLEQNWQTGDFATCIDRDQYVQALGVRFALSDILEMVPFERRALIARSMSVAGDGEWCSAKEARQIAYRQYRADPMYAGGGIIALARLGFIAARAVLAQGSDGKREELGWSWEEREWDIATWFWTDFTAAKSSAQNWELGRFSGKGRAPSGFTMITLSGVHFLRASLMALAPADTITEPAASHNGGRKPIYDWRVATNVIWGRIHRGELRPEKQGDIETELIDLLTKGDKEPGESTVRPFAKPIWEELQKAKRQG